MPRKSNEYETNIDDRFEHRTNLFEEFAARNLTKRKRRKYIKNENIGQTSRGPREFVPEEGTTSDFILRISTHESGLSNFETMKQGIQSAYQHENRYNIANSTGSFNPTEAQKNILQRGDFNEISTFEGFKRLQPKDQMALLKQLGIWQK